MGRKRKTPEQIAAELLARRRADFEAVNLDPDAAVLAAYADVEIERVGKRSAGNRAWRSNVFRLLLERKAITTNQHEAACRLIETWAAWKGLDGKGETLGEVVDGSAGCAELVTDRMRHAGFRLFGRQEPRIVGIFEHLTTQDQAILSAFMVATVEEDRPMAWRGIMERCGVFGRDRQTAVFVGACEALRAVVEGDRRAA